MAQTAYAISPDRQVFWLDSDGNKIPLSSEGFALQINADTDATIWAVTTDVGPNGNTIQYLKGFPTNKSDWVALDRSLGADQVVGRTGGNCVFRAPDNSLHTADINGNHKQIAPAGTAQQVATLGGLPIYIMTDEFVDDGAVIKMTSDEGATWQVVNNGHAAKADQILLQVYNFLVFLDQDGAPGFLDGTNNNQVKLVGPAGTGLYLGLGNQNQWWVVSPDSDKSGGNLLKYWDGGSVLAESWHTTNPPIAGISVAGL